MISGFIDISIKNISVGQKTVDVLFFFTGLLGLTLKLENKPLL